MTRTLATVSAAILVSGCASIFNGQTQTISFQSEPTGAALLVTNRAGEQVHSGTTPASVTLKRGAGYFKSESYTIRLSKPGFTTKEVVVTGTMSGWYIGNLVFGGLIGMLAVDPVTGGMYVFPDAVSTPLEAASTPTASATPTLTIVSLDSLSPEVRARARLVSKAQ